MWPLPVRSSAWSTLPGAEGDLLAVCQLDFSAAAERDDIPSSRGGVPVLKNQGANRTNSGCEFLAELLCICLAVGTTTINLPAPYSTSNLPEPIRFTPR